MFSDGSAERSVRVFLIHDIGGLIAPPSGYLVAAETRDEPISRFEFKIALCAVKRKHE